MGLFRYLAKRAAFLLVTLVVVGYLIVLIANHGGLLDRILEYQIQTAVERDLGTEEDFRGLPEEIQRRLIEEEIQRRIERRGLNLPFVIKSFVQTYQALTFSLGEALTLRSTEGSVSTLDIVLERLPRSLLLFTTATVVAAFSGIWIGFRLARRARWTFDREWPLFSGALLVVPSWILALFLMWAFSYRLHIFPLGGITRVPPPTDPIGYALDVAHHLALPLITIAISSIGFWVYITRNLVLKTIDEDFVQAAKKRDLRDRRALHREALRASYPRMITYSALPLIASWSGTIITEGVLGWPGLGMLYLQAIMLFDLLVIVAVTVTYAMLFVSTVFMLDLIHELLGPRIRSAGEGG